jgi:mannosyltransferase OCH1-like enzyme
VKYPKKSRLVQSFRLSGWEHRFYTDDESGSFRSTHFPPEVREAYDTLLPGAFKADFFRYCVLLINGGLYADVDILLESNLDISVQPDVGLMTPSDEVSLRLSLFRLSLFRYE